MTNTERIAYLNENYQGEFRALTENEKKQYSDILNSEDDAGAWCDPYAIRESTKDIISFYDTELQTTDYLFSHVD